MLEPDARQDLLALLAWYGEVGVDAAIGSAPVDWIARSGAAPGADVLERLRAPPGEESVEPPRAAAEPPPARPVPPRPPLAIRSLPPQTPAPPQRAFHSGSPDVSAHAARTAAATAQTLGDLHAALSAFDGCGLKATAKNLCLYRGAERARVMLIGEAPGREEDLEGKPFVGPAGQLLDLMLSAIGLDESAVHITNVVYWRPPGNRTPTPQETTVCRPFLERQIALVAPDVIVPLGGAAAKHVLDVADGIMRIRGRWHEVSFGGHQAKALATLHPAYLLRTPAAKRQAWRDLLTIRAELAP